MKKKKRQKAKSKGKKNNKKILINSLSSILFLSPPPHSTSDAHPCQPRIIQYPPTPTLQPWSLVMRRVATIAPRTTTPRAWGHSVLAPRCSWTTVTKLSNIFSRVKLICNSATRNSAECFSFISRWLVGRLVRP